MPRLWQQLLLASLFLAMVTLAGTVVQGPVNVEGVSQPEEGSDPEQPVTAAVQPTPHRWKPGMLSPMGDGGPHPVPTAVRRPLDKKPYKPGKYSPMGGGNDGPPQRNF